MNELLAENGVEVMDKTNFECLHCGRCCERIIIETEYGINVGMYLQPSEIKLFRRFPSAVLPYIGLAKKGRSKPKKVVCYQLAVEPCPLYDKTTKTCTQYDSRPLACRAYPFNFSDGRLTAEEHCKWYEGVENTLEVGKTRINAPDAIQYAHKIHNIFMKYEQPLNLPVMMIFDVRKKKWVIVEKS